MRWRPPLIVMAVLLANLVLVSLIQRAGLNFAQSAEITTDTANKNSVLAKINEGLAEISADFTKTIRESALRNYQELMTPDIGSLAQAGQATLLSQIPTNKPVVFLTIDDGLTLNDEALDYINKYKLNPTLFLTSNLIGDTDYFKEYQDSGYSIENHTFSHSILKGKTLKFQTQEFCSASNWIKNNFGTSPNIARPPAGEFDSKTLVAAKSCGMDYLVHWRDVIDKGVVYTSYGNKMQAGDIVLMHFRPAIMDDLRAFRSAAKKYGLYPANLAEWLK